MSIMYESDYHLLFLYCILKLLNCLCTVLLFATPEFLQNIYLKVRTTDEKDGIHKMIQEKFER
jgi:hypothetical protein